MAASLTRTRLTRIVFFLLIGLLLASLAMVYISYQRATQNAGAAEESGIALGAPFDLVHHDGRRIDSRVEFGGKPMLIYFGFTHCPDICPTSLADLSAAYDGAVAAGAELDDTVLVFVTLDPERDSAELVGEYAEAFHEQMVGLTGSLEDIQRTAKDWRVYYQLRKDIDPEHYPVDHSSFAYLTGRDHRLVEAFSTSRSVEEMSQIIQKASKKMASKASARFDASHYQRLVSFGCVAFHPALPA